MDRQEPHFGKPDLSDVDIRPRSYQRPSTRTTNARQGLSVWGVAIGIFLGLSAFSVATLVVLGFGAKAVADEQTRREQAAMAQLNKVLRDPDPLGWRAQAAKDRAVREARIRAAKQLNPGERCIQGKRFYRVDNGWIELPNRPC